MEAGHYIRTKEDNLVQLPGSIYRPEALLII